MNEARLYRDVYRVLFAGVVISNLLFAIGLVLDSKIWLQTATVLLIATPIVRVGIALHAFVTEKNVRFVVVTGAVLAVIATTIILSRFNS